MLQSQLQQQQQQRERELAEEQARAEAAMASVYSTLKTVQLKEDMALTEALRKVEVRGWKGREVGAGVPRLMSPTPPI